MAYTLTGVRNGSSSCELDNCGRNLKRLFVVTDETSGRTLTLGRRCAAKLTGWKPHQLDTQLQIQLRRAELAVRRSTIIAEFPALPATVREDIVCCDNAWRPEPTAGGWNTWRERAAAANAITKRNDNVTKPSENTALSRLTLTRHYYCDGGQHSGNYYVRLEGYVPLDVLSTLVEENGPSQSGALPISPVRGELADLLDAGLLKAGEQVYWYRRYKGLRHTALVRNDGRLELPDGTIHATPTRAINALGTHHNGWKLWRTKDGRTLGELRTELQSLHSKAEDLPAQ